jgi:hypothetical protein
VTSPVINSTGNLTASGVIIGYGQRVSAQGTGEPSVFCHRTGEFAAGMILNSSNQLIFASVDGNGVWQSTRITLDSGGNLGAAGAITATATVQGNYLQSNGNGHAAGWFQANQLFAGNGVFARWNGDTAFGMFGDNPRYFQFMPQWYWQFNTGTGDLYWYKPGAGTFWFLRPSDNLSYNGIGPVGGYGPYNNYSDRRAKRNIRPATHGLSAILRLRPLAYERIPHGEGVVVQMMDGNTLSPVAPRSEIGFLAQDVREVIPLAVTVMGIPLPDGTGGMDDDEPSLGITYDAITAALVLAVQELAAEVATLKGARK